MTDNKAVAGLLVIHLAMLGWMAAWHAPVCNEVGHLTAGLYAWRSGQFFMYRVNPPLVKLVAAIPAALGNPKEDWRRVLDSPDVRTEFQVGHDFIHANAPDACRYFTAGRLLCLPFTVLGGWMCFLWGRSLYGSRSGLIACLLWCASPVVLGWGSVFTPDAAATSFGLLAAYRFRDWLVSRTWGSAMWAGLAFGVCELTKTTWIVLFPLWPLLWLAWRYRDHKERVSLKAEVGQLGLILVIGVYIMNVGYGFEGTGRTLGSYDFVSRTFTGHDVTRQIGNRFRGTILANIPVPLPYNYVRGIDLQKVDFEEGMSSYLLGTWSNRGWWYYYPVAACLKLPLGMLLLLGMVSVCHVLPRAGLRFSRDEMVLIVPAAVVFVLVCSQTGFGRYIRYILPSLPAAFILISKLWAYPWPRWVSRCQAGLLLWSVLSSAWVYPYSLNYFNELAGGPAGGHRYLLGANVDWGQDLVRLKSWMQDHPVARPMFCAVSGFVDPPEIGVDSIHPHMIPPPGGTVEEDYTPAPGWYAISVNELFEQHAGYRYLLKYTPVDRVGYSIWIYHIPPRPATSTNNG